MNTHTTQSGFVILFTMLISSIILAIALGISGIAYNESLLSASAREATISFFAADSGVECALFNDSLSPSPFSGTGTSFTCNGESFSPPTSLVYTNTTYDNYEFYINLTAKQTCAYVTVQKGLIDPVTSAVYSRIISRGYNVPCPIVKNIILSPSASFPAKMTERLIETRY